MAGLQSSSNPRPQSATVKLEFTGPKGISSHIYDSQLTEKWTNLSRLKLAKMLINKIYLFFLLINKNVIQNFIDQQNLQNGEPPKC